jgi:hypothetical protein
LEKVQARRGVAPRKVACQVWLPSLDWIVGVSKRHC